MKNKIIYLLLLLFWSCMLQAQNVVVNAEIDSLRRLIGQQARIKLKVSYDAGKRIVMPVFENEIVEGVEIIETLKDTQQINDGKRHTVTHEYIVTSFDTAFYTIPPFEVLVEGEPYYSQELLLAVLTYPIEEIDTANVEFYFGPKDIWSLQLQWIDVQSSVLSFVLLLILTALLVWVIVRCVNNKPIIRIVKVKPKLPAHVVAYNEIERIKSDNSWRASGNSKEYYTLLTDVLRNYLTRRFNFNATEMTTAEIVDKLLSIKDKESIKELKELLSTADLVKFAKFNPPMNENDRNIMVALDFINATKLADVDENPQPTERRIVDKRSATEKKMLYLSIVVLSILILLTLIYFITELYNLLS